MKFTHGIAEVLAVGHGVAEPKASNLLAAERPDFITGDFIPSSSRAIFISTCVPGRCSDDQVVVICTAVIVMARRT